MIIHVQYRPWALQHLHVHAHKLHAIWRISTNNAHKKLACKFLHELLHTDFLHSNLSVFLRWLILCIKIQASCVYFFTTANVADVKLETDIVGKRLFTVLKSESNLLYTFSWYDHAIIANVTFCNQRFPWLLAEALLTVHVNLDAGYLPCQLLFRNHFNVLACIQALRLQYTGFLDLELSRVNCREVIWRETKITSTLARVKLQ